MALFDKADFIGTHVVDSVAKRDFVLRYSNNRGHQCFEAMSVAAGGTAPPLTLATMLQTYTLDADGVQAVLSAGAVRGHEFLTAVKFLSIDAAATIEVPCPDLVVSFSVDGLWFPGSALKVAITVTGGTDISTSIANGKGITLTPDEFAADVASALNTIGAGDVQCGATGNLVQVSAVGAVTALTITTAAPA